MRRGAPAVAVACILALSACDALFVDPTPIPGEVGLQLAVEQAPEAVVAVFERGDRIRIRIERADGALRDTTVSIRNEGGIVRARLALAPAELAGDLELGVELLDGGTALFVGEGIVRAESAGIRKASIVLNPIPAGIVVSGIPTQFSAIGDAAQLPTGTVTFASGEVIPGLLPTWTSRAPSIVEIGPNRTAIARSNGTALLSLSYGLIVRLFVVTVRQVAVGLTLSPAQIDLGVGQTRQLQVLGVDRQGTPLQEGWTQPLTWGVNQTREVVSVTQTGLITAISQGQATVSAWLTDRSLSASAEVRVALGFTLPPAELAWRGRPVGIAVGDLSGQVRVVGTMVGHSPSWSPDRSHIAFVNRERDGSAPRLTAGLYVMDLSGNAIRLPTTAGNLDRVNTYWPEYSADGAWIYFGYHGQFGSPRIYRIRPDGSGMEKLTEEPAGAATSSPDGSRFAFVTIPESGVPGDLVVQPIGGTRQVIVPGVGPQNPKWSPDGQWIAFTVSGTGELYVVRPDGSGRRQIPGPPVNGGISWSPDGKWIVAFGGSAMLVDVAAGTMTYLDWGTGFDDPNGVSWWR